MIALATLLTLTLLPQAPELSQPVGGGGRQAVEPAKPALAAELRIHELGQLSEHALLQQVLADFRETSEPNQVDLALGRVERLDELRSAAALKTEHLLNSIRELIEPPLDEEQHALRHLDHGRVLLIGTAAQQEWLAEFLRAADDFRGLIQLEAKVFNFRREFLPSTAELKSGTLLSDAETQSLLAELDAAGLETVSAPTITCFPFQQANLSILNQIAYLRDYEIKVLPNLNREVADPIIDTVKSGLTLDLRGVPLANNELGIFVDLELSELEHPVPSAEIVIGAGRHEVTIQLPQVTRIRVTGHYNVRPGETLLLKTADPTGLKEVLVLLKTSRVDAAGLPLEQRR